MRPVPLNSDTRLIISCHFSIITDVPDLKQNSIKDITYLYVLQQLPHQRPIKLCDGARLGINEVAKRLYTVPVLSFGSFVHISLLLLFTKAQDFFRQIIVVRAAFRPVDQFLLQLSHPFRECFC